MFFLLIPLYLLFSIPTVFILGLTNFTKEYNGDPILLFAFWPYFLLVMTYKKTIGSVVEYYSGSEVKINSPLEAIEKNGMCIDSGHIQVFKFLKIAKIGNEDFKLSQSDVDKVQKFLSSKKKTSTKDKIQKSTELLNEFVLKKSLEELKKLEEFSRQTS